MSFTVQNVIDAAQRDMMMTIGASHPNSVDYVNRVQLDLLGASSWYFRETGPVYFLTRTGQTEYWLGTGGDVQGGKVDTGLNLTDFRAVKKNSVRDISNFRTLEEVKIAPTGTLFRNNDSDSRIGTPKQYKNTPGLTPSNVLSIYPAANNQNSASPAPENALLGASSGGSMAARTYYVQITFADDQGGESLPCPEMTYHIPVNQLLTIKVVAPLVTKNDTGINYNGYWVYLSTTSGAGIRQPGFVYTSTTIPVQFSTIWTEPTTGIAAGTVSVPTTSTIAAYGGYIIEFTYYPTRTQLTLAADTLLIPDDYKDVVVAGTNLYVAQYLERRGDIAFWGSVYAEGKRRMVRDKNYTPGGGDFMRPDSAATSWGNWVGGQSDAGPITVT